MDIPRRRFITLVLSFCFLCSGIHVWAGPSSASPNLLAAMKSLEAAKTADNPMPDLKAALDAMNKATNNAGGKKDMAIQLTNEAVDLAKAGNKIDMVPKIDHAISELHAGMDRGGHRRRQD